MSWGTTLWAVIVRLVSGYHPTTYSYQKSLPFLPVPALDDTVNKFVTSIEPLYDNPEENEEFQRIKKDAEVNVPSKHGSSILVTLLLMLSFYISRNSELVLDRNYNVSWS